MEIIRDGVRLIGADAGSGEPALLLVHGWGTDRGVLAPLCERARARRRVVALDLRGFGASDAQPPYDVATHADDLAVVVRALGLERPVVVGHSLGGLIALDFAARYPTHTGAAVLLEPMALAPALLEGLEPILADLRGPEFRTVAGGLLGYLAGPDCPPEARTWLVETARRCRQDVLVAAMEGILAFDSAAAAAAVTSPLLYLGTSTPYADLTRFRALCPQLETGQLYGCGHYFPLEVPEQIDAMIERFLALRYRAQTRPPSPQG